MSYCRWSSEHGECDVYVYVDVAGGWTTHVAERRRKNRYPDEIKALYPREEDPDFDEKLSAYEAAEKEWLKSQPHETIMAKDENGAAVPMYLLADSEFIALPAPEAGQSFHDATPGECADRLERLRARGLNCPQYAIDALRKEQAELPKHGGV